MTTDLTTQALNTGRTQNHFYELRCFGLRPSTVHTITFMGVDHGFATRQFGKDFGASLISDSDGELKLGMLVQLPYSRDLNFELPQTQTLQYQSEQLNANRKAVNTADNYREVKITSADGRSVAVMVINIKSLLTAGTVRTLYAIE